MTLEDLSEIAAQNITYDNKFLEIRKMIFEDGVWEVLFWEPEEDFVYCEMDFGVDRSTIDYE